MFRYSIRKTETAFRPASLRRYILGVSVAVCLLVARAAPAGQIAFNFSSLNTSSSASDIATLMTQQAHSTVTVATGSNIKVNTTYAGDGHVVGPTFGSTVVPWTLGDSGGTVFNPTAPTSASPTYSAYLASTGSFTIIFSVPVYSVAFDFEIFAAASPTTPQFEFSGADKNGAAVAMYYNNALVTSLPWTVDAIKPGDPNQNQYLPSDTYTHSPNSGPSSTEQSKQLLGVAMFQFTSSAPAYQLTFADWPEEIGINNLVINYPMPEPSSAVLFGFGALGVAGFTSWSRRRRRVSA
jgi:hypothetical protein